jgi:hypothetical protein
MTGCLKAGSDYRVGFFVFICGRAAHAGIFGVQASSCYKFGAPGERPYRRRLRRFNIKLRLIAALWQAPATWLTALAPSPPQLPASQSLAQPLSLSPSLPLSLSPAQPAPSVEKHKRAQLAHIRGKMLAKNPRPPQPLTFAPGFSPWDFLGARMRNPWVFHGLLVDPKGDPQEPLREAASNRRFRGRFCLQNTRAEVKYFRSPSSFRCRSGVRNAY